MYKYETICKLLTSTFENNIKVLESNTNIQLNQISSGLEQCKIGTKLCNILYTKTEEKFKSAYNTISSHDRSFLTTSSRTLANKSISARSKTPLRNKNLSKSFIKNERDKSLLKNSIVLTKQNKPSLLITTREKSRPRNTLSPLPGRNKSSASFCKTPQAKGTTSNSKAFPKNDDLNLSSRRKMFCLNSGNSNVSKNKSVKPITSLVKPKSVSNVKKYLDDLDFNVSKIIQADHNVNDDIIMNNKDDQFLLVSALKDYDDNVMNKTVAMFSNGNTNTEKIESEEVLDDRWSLFAK